MNITQIKVVNNLDEVEDFLNKDFTLIKSVEIPAWGGCTWFYMIQGDFSNIGTIKEEIFKNHEAPNGGELAEKTEVREDFQANELIDQGWTLREINICHDESGENYWTEFVLTRLIETKPVKDGEELLSMYLEMEQMLQDKDNEIARLAKLAEDTEKRNKQFDELTRKFEDLVSDYGKFNKDVGRKLFETGKVMEERIDRQLEYVTKIREIRAIALVCGATPTDERIEWIAGWKDYSTKKVDLYFRVGSMGDHLLERASNAQLQLTILEARDVARKIIFGDIKEDEFFEKLLVEQAVNNAVLAAEEIRSAKNGQPEPVPAASAATPDPVPIVRPSHSLRRKSSEECRKKR